MQLKSKDLKEMQELTIIEKQKEELEKLKLREKQWQNLNNLRESLREKLDLSGDSKI